MFGINDRIVLKSVGTEWVQAMKEDVGIREFQITEESLPVAIALLDKELESDPSNARLLTNRGILRYILNSDPLALEDFNRAVELSPNDSRSYGARAWFKYQERDWVGTVEDSSHAIELEPHEDFSPLDENYLVRAWSLYHLGETDRAFVDISHYIENNPDPIASAYHLRGVILISYDQLLAAKADIDASIRLDDTNPVTYALRGEILRARSDYAGAMEDLNTALHFDPDSTMALIHRGSVYRDTGEFTKALEDVNKALKIESERGECRDQDDKYNEYSALVARGTLRRDMEDYPSAIRDYDAAIRLEDVEPSLYKKSFVRVNRGDCLDMLGDSEGAIADYREAAETDPTNGHCFYRWGEMLMTERRYTDALPLLEKAYELYKAADFAPPLGFYCWLIMCYEYTGKETKAIALATQVINEGRAGCQDLGGIHFLRASLAAKTPPTRANGSQFESDVFKAIELGVPVVGLFEWAGMIYVNKGSWENAKKMYKRLWAADPTLFRETYNAYKTKKGTPKRLLKLLKKVMEESKDKDARTGLSTSKYRGADEVHSTGTEKLSMQLEFQSEDDILYSFRRSGRP